MFYILSRHRIFESEVEGIVPLILHLSPQQQSAGYNPW